MNSYGKYEAIKYTLDDGAYKPERQHRSDAGIDLRSMYDYVIYPHDCKAIETGVHFEIPLDHNSRHSLWSGGYFYFIKLMLKSR